MVNPAFEHAAKACCWGATTVVSGALSIASAIITVALPALILVGIVFSWYLAGTLSPIDLIWFLPVSLLGGGLMIGGAAYAGFLASRLAGRCMLYSASQTLSHSSAVLN